MAYLQQGPDMITPPHDMLPGAREAHVWYAWAEQCSAPRLLERYRALLNREERERLDRYAFDYLRLEYLLTRALCRTTLSRYADVHPGDWTFCANRYGRPEIAGPAGVGGLRFNLSNARSLVACVVTRDADAGIDVEESNHAGDLLSIADTVFSPSERAQLRALPQALQRQRFFDLWTLKESYIKARGMGLSLPLQKFSFDVGAPAIGISFAPEMAQDAAHWQFALQRLGPCHTLAVSMERGDGPDFSVSMREVIPELGDDELGKAA